MSGAPGSRAAPASGRSVAVAAFAAAVIVATGFIVVGLLPEMARNLGVSLAGAGAYVSWFAVSAALLGPPLTIAAGGIRPRRVLVAVLLVFAAGNLACVLAPGHAVVLAVRVVQGAVLPVFVSVAGVAVVGLAGPGREGRALAGINAGVVAGLVLAVPAGVALAGRAGWPASFLGLAALATLAALAVGAAFPDMGGPDRRPVRGQVGLFRQPGFPAHLLLSATLFAATFAAYTYLAAYLETVFGLGAEGVGLALMGFGIAGLAGNWAAGRVVDRGPTAATAGVAAVLALAMAAVPAAGAQAVLAVPLLAVWGAAHAAAFVLCQVRVMLAGSVAPAFAMSLNISASNLGIACGAALGGWAVERWGIVNVGLAGAMPAVLAFGLAVLVGLRAPRVRPAG
ncbi:MFS transporter [Arenibaculum sp.]|jgi:predicted MFS family arabinose efflux permease|uniref:MFS transporter n=1 Tax=Arenibaculum sp. TaxID=2865862 RepID=UPI002E0E0DBE|nr:MFS transporter [Arenibaculum sp.]